MYNITSEQKASEAELEKRGFRFANWLNLQYDGDTEDPVAFVMTRKRNGFTRYAEVDPDGSVNGREVSDYLKNL